jgi:hypothetical protein
LNASTVALLTDVFAGLPALGASSRRLSGRRVRWGAGAVSATVSEACLLVGSEKLGQILLDRLLTGDGDRIVLEETVGAAEDPDWVDPGDAGWVVAAGSSPSRPGGHRPWGRRQVIAGTVAIAGRSEVSQLETTRRGWVFLVPQGAGSAMVQAMAPAPPCEPDRYLGERIAETREIRQLIRRPPEAVTTFDAAPSIAEPLSRPGWIAAGGDAIRVDPLCGDGVGYAVRSAILAASVIHAVTRRVPVERALAHHRARLRAALANHLRACLRFHDTADFDATWAAERAATAAGLAELEANAPGRDGFAFQVRGFTLVPSASGS